MTEPTMAVAFDVRDYAGAKWLVTLPEDETTNVGSSTTTIHRTAERGEVSGETFKIPTVVILYIAAIYVRKKRTERLVAMDVEEVLGL